MIKIAPPEKRVGAILFEVSRKNFDLLNFYFFSDNQVR